MNFDGPGGLYQPQASMPPATTPSPPPAKRRRGRPPTRPASPVTVRHVDPDQLRRDGAFPTDEPEPATDEDLQRIAEEDEAWAEHDAAGPEEWPHTDNVIRRQTVTPDLADEEGRVKRGRNGDRARGPILAEPSGPTEEEQRIAGEMGDDVQHPTRSPILDQLKQGPQTASDIAASIHRAPNNVATRLRQLERAGFVRRTGRMLPGPAGARGGPRVEWALADPDAPLTAISTILDGEGCSQPLNRDEMRRAYFNKLLDMIDRPDAPEHLFDRIERLTGLT